MAKRFTVQTIEPQRLPPREDSRRRVDPDIVSKAIKASRVAAAKSILARNNNA
jgi:hypothetical protein